MAEKVNSLIVRILQKHSADNSAAIRELLSLLKDQRQDSIKTLRRTILLLMQKQHDWINVRIFIEKWAMDDFEMDFAKRMRVRVQEQQTGKPAADLRSDLNRLIDKYWRCVSPKRAEKKYGEPALANTFQSTVHKQKLQEKMVIEETKKQISKAQITQKPKQYKDRDQRQAKPSILKKESKTNSNPISQSKRNPLIKKTVEAVGIYKGTSLSSAESVDEQKSHPGQLTKKGTQPSSNLAQLLSRFSLRGNQTGKAEQNSRPPGKTQAVIDNNGGLNFGQSMHIQSSKKNNMTEDEYPVLKNLQSVKKLTISPQKSLLENNKNIKIKRQKYQKINPSIDFSFSAIRQKKAQGLVNQSGRKGFDSFCKSQLKQPDTASKLAFEEGNYKTDNSLVQFQEFSSKGMQKDQRQQFLFARDTPVFEINGTFNKKTQLKQSTNKEEKLINQNYNPENQSLLSESQLRIVDFSIPNKHFLREAYKRHSLTAKHVLDEVLATFKY